MKQSTIDVPVHHATMELIVPIPLMVLSAHVCLAIQEQPVKQMLTTVHQTLATMESVV